MGLIILLTKVPRPHPNGALKSLAQIKRMQPLAVIGNVSANFMSLIVFLVT